MPRTISTMPFSEDVTPIQLRTSNPVQQADFSGKGMEQGET